MRRHARGQVERTMDVHVVGDDMLAGCVITQLPPVSAAMSTMMAPYFIRPIMSVVMMIGAFCRESRPW